MDTRNTRYWLSLLLVASTIGVDATSNDTSEETREPRVSGRIVKVYSGSRPEPFFCRSEGFQSDPTNCAVFYRCVSERNGKYTVFRYQCAPGTVYDADLETCNHPRNTRRVECGGQMKPDVVNNKPEQLNEIEGSQNEVPRPISTLAPVFTEKTTKNNIVFTQKPETQSTALHTTIGAFTTVYPWIPTTVRQTESTKYWSENPTTNKLQTTSHASSDRTEICFTDGFIGDLDNCRKFYRCVGNQKGRFMRYEFYCSESTVWDDELQSCNHPWAVKRSKCGRSLSVDQVSESQTEKMTTQNVNNNGHKSKQEQLQINYGAKVTQTQTQINHGNNVEQNQTQINYGDRVNSSESSEAKQNQTQISHGSAVSQSQTQINYGNKGMQTQLQIDHSKNSSQSQSQIHETTTKQSTQQVPQQGTNGNQCSQNGFMGDPKNCKKFYRCVDNGRGGFTKYEYQCGEGTVWDLTIESCNHAWAVKECGGQISTESNKEQYTTTTLKSTTKAPMTVTQNYHTTTTQSEMEDIDVGYGNQGGNGDTTFSTSTTTSTTTEKSNSGTLSTECTSTGFIGDTNDCKIFYRCVDNGKGFTKHEFKCGDGTVWDPDIEACNHAWAVKSCGTSSSSNHKEDTTTKQTTVGVQTTVTLVQTTTQTSNLNEEYDSGYGSLAEKPYSSTSTTTRAQKQNDYCVSTGFMGDSNNCKKFYRCVDNGNGGFTKHEFTCGEGTVWDPKIEACNHAWAVEHCGGESNSQSEVPVATTPKSTTLYTTVSDKNTNSPVVTSTSSSTVYSTTELSSSKECTSSGFMGDTNNCKKFYRCVENGDKTFTRYEFTCGEGTVWDRNIEACNHAWAVEECGANSNEISEPSTAQNTQTVTTQTVNQEISEGSTEKTSSTTAKPETEISTGKCSKEGFYGNPHSCNKFYRCVDDGNGGFIKYDFTCGEGTVWNDNIQACDHPSADGTCISKVPASTIEPQQVNDEIESETTTKTSSTSKSPETQSTQSSQSSDNNCKSEGFYGDSSDCKKFYRCVDDGKGSYTKYDFVCGEGTSWNQEIQACDHESDDQTCLKSSTSSESSSTSEPPNSKPVSTTSTTEKGNDESSTNAQEYFDEKCSSEGFFPHSKDCKKFIRCVSDGNGKFTKYEFSCGDGTVWVQEIQACDHDSGMCKTQSTSSSANQETTEHSSTTPSSSLTSSSSSEESQTPSKENDEYESSNTPTQNDESDVCTSEGYYGNSNDCRKFYRCVDNGNGGYTKYDFDCGEGTAWDSNIQTCNHIDEVKTCSNNNKEDENTAQQTPKDEEQTQTTESSSSTTKQSSGSSSSSSSNDVCKEEGYYGDSQDCKKFYRCVDDGKGGYTKYDFVCGEGTIWDQDITNCNHPQDVSNPSCSSNQGESSTSSSSDSDSTTSSSQSTTSTTESSNSTSDCSEENSSKKPGGNKNVTCDQAGYYPDPNDCKKFYRCVDWDGDGKRFSVYHFECGEGTIWDPALDTCNHEESVYPPRDCSQTQSQSETTTQESTTSEKTTEESTTTEQSTTQESTTTQQSTTSEQTTTQQSTTSDQTTTQQSTTSEQTTTQQSTTSEQTTTQQSTTSEQTTTQQSTTSEQTTTQQSTTTEQTTTQQSTTSEETTTQQSTTSEQTTTQQSTTEQTTTQQSTTQDSTTEQSSTQESTTSEQTTQSTESSTTEQTEGTTEESTSDSSGTTTTESSTTTEGGQESTTEGSSSNNECPDTEDDQYLLVCPTSFKRHPKYCNMFYQCAEDDDTHEVKVAMFKCPNETIYDESQTQCVEKNKANEKCEGEMARKLRFKRFSNKEPIVVDKEKKACPNVGYYAFERNSECSPGFLKCEKSKSGKLRGLVNQCPKGYTFWSISKRCEKIQNVIGCKTSSSDWTERWNIPIDRKNVSL